MKILRIDNGSGFFRVSDDDEWTPIDEIDKEDLLKLLDSFIDSDVEMDDIDENEISNQAHQIIYRSIYEKLTNLVDNKGKFKDEADRTYLSAIEKYSK